MGVSLLLTVDIGGTTINSGLFQLDNQCLPISLIHSTQVATSKGMRAVAHDFSECVAQAEEFCKENKGSLLPIIGVGTPGNLIGTPQTIIADGTAFNLEQFSGEFNGVDMQELLKTMIWEGYSIHLFNDAIAQMCGGLNLILKKDPDLESEFLGHNIAYIGPGTGLGGGFANVTPEGVLDFYSDGHIFDVALKLDDQEPVKAEDVLSGTVFAKLGHSGKDVNDHDDLFTQYSPQIIEMGHYLSQLVTQILSGDLSKIDPINNWPESDIEKAKKTSIFLFGGSLGTKGRLSELLRETAQADIEEHHPDMILLPIPDSDLAALIGAASLIPTTLLQDNVLE
ncbi:MAG: hypothetical protein HRT90_00495 [Candidatus Margulisbacteria bacterium]|nr:hypothetical protein [Candidatus Margulisiibacteriota bacterium]